MEAESELARGFDKRLEDPFAPARKDVVMIRRERASAQEQPGHRRASGDTDRVGVDVSPNRIERTEPLEQSSIRDVTTSGPLVHVVVCVDQAGNRNAVRQMELLLRGRWRPRAHLGDEPIAGEHPAVFQLLPGARVHQPGPQQQGRHQVSTRSCGRTGTRVTGRPVAARIAATIAGPDEIVGGSPTPFSP